MGVANLGGAAPQGKNAGTAKDKKRTADYTQLEKDG
jgi:hypothetical protein